MSVPTWRRHESGVQFLDNARDLEVYTLQQCCRFPKRYMFMITQRLVGLAEDVYDNAKKANTLDPKDSPELQAQRLGYFAEAMCSVQALSSQIDIAKELVHQFVTGQIKQRTVAIPESVWQVWGEKLDKEFCLLKATYNSFYKKYRGAPETEPNGF